MAFSRRMTRAERALLLQNELSFASSGGAHGSREPGLSRSEKLGRGGTDDELVKPLIVIQRV